MISIRLILLLVFGLFSVVALGLGLTSLGMGVLSDTEMQERIQIYAALPEWEVQKLTGRRRSQLQRLRQQVNAMLSNLASAELNVKLASASWPITVTEFILIQLGLTLAGLVLGTLATGYILSGIGLGIILYMIPGVLMRRSIHQRRLKFERQLIDVLMLISGSVRAGFSLLQSMDVVVKEVSAPASEEFRQVQREVGLGVSLPKALSHMATRMQNDDLSLMVTAINIHYQVGGNLTTMLAAVTETIRERTRLFSEVRVITTQQRYTSYLISLLPFFLGAMLFVMSPTYITRLFDPGGMLCIPIGAIIGIILGHFSIQRLIKIRV